MPFATSDISLWGHYGIALAVLALLRLIPIWLAPDYLPGDIRAMRLFITRERLAPGDLLRHGHNHPILFPLLIARSRLPFALLHIVVPAISDALSLTALAIVLWQLLEEGLVTHAAAAAAIWLFVFYPANIIIYIGPRSYGLSERITMEAVFTVAVLLLLWPHQQPWLLAVAGLLFTYLMLASRFTLQVIVLVLLPTLITLGAWHKLVVLGLAFVAALLMPGMDYARRLKHHWLHLLSYRRYIGDARYLVGNRNRLPRCRGMGRARCLRRWWKFLTRTNAYTAGLLWHFPVVFAAFGHLSWPSAPLVHDLSMLVVWAAAAWLLTGFGIFKIAGIAERYLSFVLVPALIVLAVQAGDTLPWWLTIYVPAALVLWVITIGQLKGLVKAQKEKEAQVSELMQWIKTLPEDARIAAALPTPYLWLLLERLWDRFSWYDIFFFGEYDKKTILHRYPKCTFLQQGKYDYFITFPEIYEELLAHSSCYGQMLRKVGEVQRFLLFRIEPVAPAAAS